MADQIRGEQFSTACGSRVLLNLSQSNSTIITVSENQATMQVLPEALGIKAIFSTRLLDSQNEGGGDFESLPVSRGS